ncbi:MAG: phosphotransferase [Rickettsiaceae bacterium]|jgi:aminoglycoside/choline kinase family phosphotransferase|nr:phosphotransferase [Rickettsiaceae bacterium]
MAVAATNNAPNDITREKLKREFIERNGYGSFDVVNLPADASFRTYARLIKGEESFILMDSPPEHYNLEPFVKIGTHLLNAGFSAPKLFEQDHENGFMILEDLGTVSVNNLLSSDGSKETEELIYKKIIRLLIQIQETPAPKGLSLYTKELLIKEAEIFLDWFLPILHGEATAYDLKEEYSYLWNKIFNSIDLKEECLTLRDFHVDNLMYMEERNNLNQIGLLDFQDALIGSPAYDLVSLVEDARRDIDATLASELINYYLSLIPAYNRKDFLAQYSILGAQRNIRILGVFARKATRDKNSRYLSFVPRVRKHLDKDLTHPLLAPLKDWLNKVAPQQKFL